MYGTQQESSSLRLDDSPNYRNSPMDVGRMESMSFKDKLVQDWGSSSASNNKVVEDDDIEIKDEGVITGEINGC